MKNFFLLFSLLIGTISLQLNAQNAPITTIPEITADAGTVFDIPITVTDFYNIGAVSLTLTYDNTILTYQSFANNSGFPGLFMFESLPGKLIAGAFAPFPGYTIPDDFVLFTLTFYCIEEASSLLEWYDNGGSCEYTDNSYTPLYDYPTCLYFINGAVNKSSFQLDLKAYLEGAFAGSEMTTSLNNLDLVPNSQPYSGLPWNYDGQEFHSTIPENAVDWVLVEIRESTGDAFTATSEKIIDRKAGLLLKDGTIINANECNSGNLEFSVSFSDNLYVVIYHRNHIAVISADPVLIINGNGNYDFTSDEFAVLDGSLGHKELTPGIWGLTAGDSNGDGEINEMDKTNIWDQFAGNKGYLQADFSMDSQNDNKDKNDFWNLNFGFMSRVP